MKSNASEVEDKIVGESYFTLDTHAVGNPEDKRKVTHCVIELTDGSQVTGIHRSLEAEFVPAEDCRAARENAISKAMQTLH